MTTRLEHANLTVPDIDAAIAFLFCVDPEFAVWHDSGPSTGQDGAHRWAHVGIGDNYLALEEPHEHAADTRMARRYTDFGINHLGLVVDDIAAAAARLAAAGFSETHVSEAHAARIRRYFQDSAGFEWELVQYLTPDRAARFAYD